MNLYKIKTKSILIMLALTLLLSTTIPTLAQTDKSTQSTFSLTLDTFDITEDIQLTQQGTFTHLSLGNHGYTTTPGDPQLPVIRYYIELPQQAEPTIHITNSAWEPYTITHPIIPVQPSQPKDQPSQPFAYNPTTYQSTHPYLTEIATIKHIGIIRGNPMALLEINPIQYTPKTNDVQKLTTLDLTITFDNADIQQTHQLKNRYYSAAHEHQLQTLAKNYGMYHVPIERDASGYLIIVYDDFSDEIQPLADFKTSKGYDVTVTTTSQIPGGPTAQNIYNYIEDAYYNWNTPPAFVLLVGDTQQIPTFQGSSSYSEADLYFVTVDGTDFLPDIYIGRFSASTEAHVDTMVQKTMYYEAGSFQNNEWIKKAAFIASSDYGQLAEQTHNYVIDNFLTPNGYEIDKIYEASGGNTQDIYNALNDGRSLCIYSGHGYPGGWGCVPFSTSDIYNLQNADMYPLVCSHACSTNTFEDSECYGEAWLRADNKGGIAFWGASASTYWDEDDYLERGMFESWWKNGYTWIGGMTDMGLYRVYENYSGGGLTKYYYEAYNIMGDPSLQIWTDDPNYVPDTPPAPTGPSESVINVEETFSGISSDPEGTDIYYMFSWGDNTTTGWVGPYPSGTAGQASHIWTEPGTYEVRVQAKDSDDRISGWSEPSIITILGGPIIDVGLISGGMMSIKSNIRNYGATEATQVNWSISLNGGTILMGKENTGTITDLQPGETFEVSTGFVLGFGKTRVTVYAEIPEGSDFREQGATVFLFFVHITPGGG